MKKILSFLILLIFSATLSAQKDVTQFLGIPVDGSKSAMIQKLKAKGFTSSLVDKDILVGKFNGTDVNIHIVTNKDKVYRIAIFDANPTNEVDIKIRFNNLCQQFQDNTKYLPASLSSSDYILSDEEDISYGLFVKKKRYQATYYQLSAVVDTVAMQKDMQIAISSKYTEDEMSNPTEELQKEMITTALSYILEKYSKKQVWFMINENYGKYYITMFYDNEYNKANGDDL
ncbi:MAG: hypothetical protein LBS20_07510 [Prevotella sp.]|jgi:hypothetical protein|nr:hypothetical protein [Prevotella sp.]